jgi:hypothetical protein
METKPYNLQAPEQIAKEYGGNKQKIAEAMQMGVLDPTAGTLAGMFIDRMRAAAQAEQAPQQTVAEQIFAPPAPMGGMPPQGGLPTAPMAAPPAPMGPPAGLGATPEAAQMPQMGMPPQGMPPQDMPPQEQPPMGMAEGGMVPPYANGGGLSQVPLPAGMFDEPNNGGYANGGIVAFFEGGLVKNKPSGMTLEEEDKWLDSPEGQAWLDSQTVSPVAAGAPIVVSAQNPPPPPPPPPPREPDPEQYYNFYRDPTLNKTNVIDKLAPRQTKYADELNKFYENVRSPEAQKAQAKDDFFAALGALGAKMASTPGTLFQSFNAGAADAIPQLATSAKERRAEQRDAVKALAVQEGLSNKEALEVANVALGMTGKYGEFRESDLSRQQEAFLTKLKEDREDARNASRVAAGLTGDRIAAGASRFGSIQLTKRDVAAAVARAIDKWDNDYSQTPKMENMKQTNLPQFLKERSKFINDSVYGPAINLD